MSDEKTELDVTGVPVDTTRVPGDADGTTPPGVKPEDKGELNDELPEDGGGLAEAETAEAEPERLREDGENEAEEEVDEDKDEDEDENEDEDDDDEDEDEDEDEAQARGGGSRRKKRRVRNQFLDVEAEDDDEEDDLSGDEEGLAGEDGFVQEPDTEETPGADRVYRQLDRRREQERFTEEDAEKLAERYRERYGRSSASKYGQSGASVPQQLLLPSVDDPMIFGINCRQGREREAVKAVLRKQLSLQYSNRTSAVFSAFQRDGFPGRIYVEAATEAAALAAVAGIPNVFSSSRVLKVPIREYPDMFHVARTQDAELQPGRYVRIKRGKYAGDLAVVIDLSENGLDARLKLVPRLDYGRTVSVSGQTEKRKRGGDRPPPRLFSSTEAAQYDARGLMRNGTGNVFVYNGEDYVQGFLHKDFRIAMLETTDVHPTLAEIAQFQDAQDGDIDLASLGESLRSSTAAFAEGERVEVMQGEQTGMQGRVTDVNAADAIVTLSGDREPYLGLTVSVPAAQLRKHFAIGDHVRVVRGNYKDDTGLVVASEKGRVTLLSDSSQSEITVFARDLRAASDTAVQNQLGAYGLQDLVQLNAQVVGCIVDVERDSVRVLAQDGQVMTLKPESIAMKLRAGGQRSATDAHGREVTVGDTVRELTGEQATGTIIHIYHQFVFMHNRERTENLGVFVNRVSQIATVATKQAREKGLDLSRMNPAAQASAPAPAPKAAHFNTRRIIGQKVSIGPGSGYKGLKGVVRDASETAARVELEAKNKVVTVDVQKLLFTSPATRKLVPLREFMNPYGPSGGSQRPGGPGGPGGGATPGRSWNSGGKTPAWASGGKTPAWASGGKTPAWASGGKTPAWNSSSAGAGGRTPAWNSGGRTPAWNASGGRTPAWNSSGAKTPAWNAGDGGKTPAWSAGDGGKTPAWSATDGGRTPAWSASGSRTPAWSAQSDSWDSGRSNTTAWSPGAAASPDTAATPGPAPTPGGSWDDAADVPQYEDDDDDE